MKKSLPRPKIQMLATSLLAALFLISCGTYQQSSYYEDDGIYSNNNRVVGVEKRNAEAVRLEKQESDIYGDYFGQKAQEYDEILEDEIFTDIDSYSSQISNDSIPLGEQTTYFANNNTYNGNPGWGDNPTSVSINVYDNSWAWGGLGWGWGWNDPWLWNGWGWGGYGWGWGWNNPWRWNRWGWGGIRLGLGLEQPVGMEPLGLGWLLWLRKTLLQ